MQYYTQTQLIKEVTHARYLGIIIDSHLTWNEHIKHVTIKANNAKSFLQRAKPSCPINIKTNCYKTFPNSLVSLHPKEYSSCGISAKKIC